MRDIVEIYNLLYDHYGPQHWWPANTPYEMMVGAVLTQNTAWSNVKKALANFGGNLTPAFIEGVSPQELIDIIRPSGFYNQKYLRLKSLTGWYRQYHYDIMTARQSERAKLRAELLAVNGIGRETADSILLYALEKPFFVVDAYTKRIFSRLGYAMPKDYDEIQACITQNIPQDISLYNEFHALIVAHAKQHCKARPVCGGCVLEDRCKQCF